MSNRKLNLRNGAGGLAYVPSQTVVYKLERHPGSDQNLVPTAQTTLEKPAIVPLVSIDHTGPKAKIYYDGDLWWANASDLYEVEESR